MEAHEREGLKEQLRAMAAGRGDGIDLDTPERWCVEGVMNAAEFFRGLSLLIPEDSNLYIEGTELDEEVVQFYEANRSKNAVCVVRDMIFPAPDMFHVAFGRGVQEKFAEYAQQKPREKCFFHIKGYQGETLLFAFHDAFDGSDLLVSGRVEEERVREFATAVGATYKREENTNAVSYTHLTLPTILLV